MFYVCVRDVMDVVFFVCIGAVGAHHHADVVCVCLVCILWQFPMLCSALLAVC